MSIKVLAKYVLLMLMGFFAVSIIYFNAYSLIRQPPTTSGAQGVIGRLDYYKSHMNEFDLVFLGDSRTYCGIHSFLIDPLLGTNSINLAQFAHWLPTQYSMIKDLMPFVPKKATVIWTIGHANFFGSTGIQRIYPIGIENGVRFLSWNVPTSGLMDNLLYFNPATHLVAARNDARQQIINILDKPFHLPFVSLIGNAHAASLLQNQSAKENCSINKDVECAEKNWRNDSRFADFSVMRDEKNNINSMVFYTARGSYYRVELEKQFFRNKQKELTPARFTEAQAQKWSMGLPDPGLWRLFEEILGEFRRQGINVIVNEIEEAPFVYSHPLVKEKYRDFMRNVVKKRVEVEGFHYVRIDYDQLNNDDYFDYNHLNSKGSDKFALRFAKAIEPYISYKEKGI